MGKPSERSNEMKELLDFLEAKDAEPWRARPALMSEFPEFLQFLRIAQFCAKLCVNGMRYLVKAKVKPGQEKPLLAAIESGKLGRGSVAGDEYVEDMMKARIGADGVCTWVEVCFCATPLQEERPYWEEYFNFLHIKDAHSRKNCRDANGTEPWACCSCDCTEKLERRLEPVGESFLSSLKKKRVH